MHRRDHVELLGSTRIVSPAPAVAAWVVRTRNLLAELDPAGHWLVTQEITRLSHELADDRAHGRRRRRLPEGPTFGHQHRWRELLPSLSALWPLQDPSSRSPLLAPLRFAARSTPEDDWRWWAHVADGVGIRSRAAVLEAILDARFRGRGPLRWLSLTGAAIVPVVAAAARLGTSRTTVEVTLWDAEPATVEAVAAFARRVDERLTAARVDPLDVATFPPAAGRFDLVEAVGLFDYLPDEPIRPGRWASVPAAADVLRAALGLVRPGGTVVLSNLLDAHPQLDVVRGLTAWPSLRPRGVADLVALTRAAGVDDDAVEVHLPDDGAYAVVAIAC